MWFCRRWEFLIFHPIWLFFFASDFYQWVLSVAGQPIFSNHFRAQRKWEENLIWYNMENFYFDFDGFSRSFLMKNSTKVTRPVLRIIGIKMITYPVIFQVLRSYHAALMKYLRRDICVHICQTYELGIGKFPLLFSKLSF